MKKTYKFKFQTIANAQMDNSALEHDLATIGSIIFPLFGDKLRNFEESMANIERRFTELSSEPATIEKQRLHAPQKTDSCELKSTTTAMSYLMDDEVSYQYLILSLLKVASADGLKSLSIASKSSLMAATGEVELRLKTARETALRHLDN